MVPTYTQGISSYHCHLCYCHKIQYNILWHALFKSRLVYTYRQSGRRWYSIIIGRTLGHTHWENVFEMHHLESVALIRWSSQAESPQLRLRRTTCYIQREFIRKSGYGSRSAGIGWEDMILINAEIPTQLRGSMISPTEQVRPKYCQR